MGPNPLDDASELRCVAPLVVLGAGGPELVGACTLVTNGSHTIAFSSAEVLRKAGEPLAICTRFDGWDLRPAGSDAEGRRGSFDGSRTLAVTAWTMGRRAGIGIIDLGATADLGFTPSVDVQPLELGAVHATLDAARGAPSALVVLAYAAGRFTRATIAVHVDAIDDDTITRLASPIDPDHVDLTIDGSPLFSWLPSDPVLGRPSEVVLVALATAYRIRTFKPRDQPAIAELIGLDDLGRALPWSEVTPAPTNELGQVAGEIRAASAPIVAPDLDPES